MAASAHNAQTSQVDSGRQMLAFTGMSSIVGDDTPSIDSALASILSSDLLQGKKAVSIRHNGSVYRLQATRLGKLILTK